MRKNLFLWFLIFSISFCLNFLSYSYGFLSEILDFQAMKFTSIKKEISENILVMRNLNEKKIDYIKKSFAPWQRVILKNKLNEIVEVEIFFETRNDFFRPPVKKNFLLKRIILKPYETIILLFPINRWGIEEKYGVHGKYWIHARSFQRTASGMFVSGEMERKLNLSYRHYRKVFLDKKIFLKGNVVKFTKWNMRKRLRKRYRKNYLPFHLIKIKFERR